jgi:hypothetical protein
VRKLQLQVLSVVAVTGAMVITGPAAYAAHPTLLVAGVASTNAEINGKGGKNTLQTVAGKTISCTSVTGSGKLTSETLGTYEAVFEGCTAAGVKCLGLSDAVAGHITVKGEAHLVYDNETTLGLAVADLNEAVHFMCSAKLITVTGCGLGLIKPINNVVAAGSNYEVTVKEAGGKMEDTKYTYNTGEAAKTCVLMSSENGGVAEEAGLTVEAGVGQVAVAGKTVASELMG